MIYRYCKEKLHVNHLLQQCPLGGDACNVTIRGYAVEILLFANLLANMHNKSMQLFSELLNKIQTFGKPLTFIGQPQPPNNS